jgi:hypothetical protein
MMMLSGECVLVADGRRFEHCTCAMDEGDGSERNFGFLSALSDVLEMARTAQWVEIGFKHHGHVAIRLLAINSGVGLFAFADVIPIRVTLTSGRWAVVVEGRNSRDVCICAEEQLREHRSASGLIECHVTGADWDEVAAITDYVTDVQLSMAELTDPLLIHNPGTRAS